LLATDRVRWLAFILTFQFLMPASGQSEVLHEIPFQYHDGLIWLKVCIVGKKEPLNFILDSGATVSAIDLQTAKTVGVLVGQRQPAEGVNGRDVAYRVDDFKATLMGIALPRSALAIDISRVSESCERHVDGIVGIDFFRNRIVRINFCADKICLLNNCETSTANCDMLPIKMYNGAFCVPVNIAGSPVQWMRLDTGCDAALEWVVKVTQKKHVGEPSMGVSGSSVHYVKTSARLGKYHFSDITAGIHGQQMFPGEDGLLGNGLLSKFCVTIDEPGSRVILERVTR
jgi:Aspartyl protease